MNGLVAEDNLPPGFEGFSPANQLKNRLAQIPVIKWRAPPKVSGCYRFIALLYRLASPSLTAFLFIFCCDERSAVWPLFKFWHLLLCSLYWMLSGKLSAAKKVMR